MLYTELGAHPKGSLVLNTRLRRFGECDNEKELYFKKGLYACIKFISCHWCIIAHVYARKGETLVSCVLFPLVL